MHNKLYTKVFWREVVKPRFYFIKSHKTTVGTGGLHSS